MSILVASAKPKAAWQQTHCSMSLVQPTFALSLCN